MSEAHDERMQSIVAQFRGPRGPRGQQGESGTPGVPLSRAVRRAIVWLFVVNLALIAAVGLGLVHYINQNNAQRCGALLPVARQALLQDAGPANPSRQVLNSIILSDRARAARLHCGR